MFMLIIYLFENKIYFMQKKALSYLFTFFNIKKILICNLILDINLFDFFFFIKFRSSKPNKSSKTKKLFLY